jgi:hypothetical protein
MLVLPLQDLVLLSSHFVLDLLIVSTTALLQRDGRVCPRILGRRASYRYVSRAVGVIAPAVSSETAMPTTTMSGESRYHLFISVSLYTIYIAGR